MSAHGENPRQTVLTGEVKGTFWGTAACVLGLILATLGGVLFIDFTLEFLGILLGATGYVLGARRLGVATVVLSTNMLLVFLAVSQGEILGIAPTDPLALPDL